MRKHIFAILALAAALCACNKEQPTNTDPVIFTATMEGTPGTKVTLDGKMPNWEVGDAIKINKEFTYKAQSAGTTTTFWADGREVGAASTYEAIFPTSYVSGSSWGGSPTEWVYYLPVDEEYEWVDGNFNMPMYAKSNDTDLHFKNLCGVLRITVTAKQMQQVKRIRVYNSKKPMFGTFTVDSNGALALDNSADTEELGLKMRSIIYTTPVPVFDENKVFYIPIAPKNYSYLRIDVSEDGETFPYQLGTRGSVKIERNKIYDILFTDPKSTEYITVVPAELGNEDFE